MASREKLSILRQAIVDDRVRYIAQFKVKGTRKNKAVGASRNLGFKETSFNDVKAIVVLDDGSAISHLFVEPSFANENVANVEFHKRKGSKIVYVDQRTLSTLVLYLARN